MLVTAGSERIKASHQYRRGHGFEFLDFFHCLNCKFYSEGNFISYFPLPYLYE